jgi:hypothetical protein
MTKWREEEQSMKRIDQAVCRLLGDTHRPTNQQPWCTYRQIAIHLMRQQKIGGKPVLSLSTIGWFFRYRVPAGERPMHHTTILYAARTIAQWRLTDPEFDEQLKQIEAAIRERSIAPLGQPETFLDRLKQAVQNRLRPNNLLDGYLPLSRSERENRERALLAELKRKYEPVPTIVEAVAGTQQALAHSNAL